MRRAIHDSEEEGERRYEFVNPPSPQTNFVQEFFFCPSLTSSSESSFILTSQSLALRSQAEDVLELFFKDSVSIVRLDHQAAYFSYSPVVNIDFLQFPAEHSLQSQSMGSVSTLI